MTHPMLEQFVATAADEQRAIAGVPRAVRHLEATQAAKAQLRGLPADQVRAALTAWLHALIGEEHR